MQIQELQSMTVVQLRKLAKENGIILGSGQTKSTIIERIMAENTSDAEAVTVASEGVAEVAPDFTSDDTLTSDEVAIETKQSTNGNLDNIPTCADVTTAEKPFTNNRFSPATGDRYSNPRANNYSSNRGSFAQQRPVAPQRRFGPQATNDATSPENQYENAPSIDGFKLGYRASTPPRNSSYQGRTQDSSYRNNYESNHQSGGYRQSSSSYQPQRPYNGSPNPYRNNYQGFVPNESNQSDQIYRLNRDSQFQEQMTSEQIPDLLQLIPAHEVDGYLDIMNDGYGFLRTSSLLPSKDDTYVSVGQIRRFDLRTGDRITGSARIQRESERYAALITVDTVNGEEALENPNRLSFDRLVPTYPDRRIVLETTDKKALAIRLVDLIAPIGYGQRAMIVTPPMAAKHVFFRDLCKTIKANNEDAEIMVLLIDVAPEDATEIRDAVDAEVFATTFADSPDMQTRMSETMLERAMRMVEAGKDVVLLLDSLSKLSKAYQSSQIQGSRASSTSLNSSALVKPKRFFGSARNTREAGSLTVLATISVDTASRVDEIVFEEFKQTPNMILYLGNSYANDPIIPMIDLARSHTKKEDLLFNDKEREGLQIIRKVLSSARNDDAILQLIDMMKKTKCNADLFKRLPGWLELWEKSTHKK